MAPGRLTRRAVIVGGMAGLCGAGAFGQDPTGTIIQGRTFQGTRGDGTESAGGEALRAADGMTVSDCQFLDFGNGAVRVANPVRNLTIEDCQAYNMYRFLEDTASGVPDASLRDFVVRRVIASHLERGFLRLRYQSSGGLIEDVTATCKDSGGALYCVGFALDDEASDITYRRVRAHGFREVTRPAGSYWNGDGFTDERGNSGIRYLDCSAADCTDGGFDLKSAEVLLENCVARSNKRNFRLWTSGTLRDCQSHTPVWRGGSGGKSHISFHGAVGAYVLERPVVRAPEGNTAPVFFFATNQPAEILIRDADIDAPSAPLIRVEGPAPNIRFDPPRENQRIRTES
jgi:hypothetical protein